MKYKIAPNAVVKELDGEAVALNLETGKYYGLNEVGARMWALLMTSNSTDDVVESILVEYEVGRGEIETDLTELINELFNHGLLEEVS